MASYDPLDPETDTFRPPTISTLVGCLHCGQEYDSYRIEWRIENDADGRPHGFWCCPIPGCGGCGFGFDIFPVDPEYRDENGNLMWNSDEEADDADEDGEELFDESADLDLPLQEKEPEDESADGGDEALPW